MAWAFRTNLPTPNLDRRLLFPLALTSPIYTLRDLWTLFQELKAYDARRLGSRLAVPFFLPERARRDHPDLPGHRVLPGGSRRRLSSWR